MMRQNHKKTSKANEHHVPEVLEELDHEAKREWKNAVRFKNENNWLFTGFVMLIAALVIINTLYVVQSNKESPASSSSAATQQKSGKVLRSLQRAETPDFDAYISNVTEKDTHDPAYTFADTETMLIFDITIKNNTPATQQIIPSSQLFIHDRDGGLYKLHASSFVTNPLAAQDVASGQTITGQVSFVIPKRQTQPLLYVDLGWYAQAPVVFDVLH